VEDHTKNEDPDLKAMISLNEEGVGTGDLVSGVGNGKSISGGGELTTSSSVHSSEQRRKETSADCKNIHI
jgi:hypothetical protein